MAHIVHLTTVHRPFSTRIFQRQCRTLAQAGYEVSLVVRHDKHEIIDGVRFVPIPRYENRVVRMILGTWAAYQRAHRLQADLYHFHDPELLPVGILLKLSTGARVVYDVHENHTQKILARSWLPRLLRPVVSQGFHLIEKISVKGMDGIVAVTEDIAHQFSHPRVRVVKNYPLMEKLRQFSGKRQDSAENYKMIYTGGLTRHRGVKQVIQALPLVKTRQANLIVVGRSDGADFERDVRALPGFEKVDYRGLVSFEEVYQLMNSAALGFVCNQPGYDYERAQPNKLFEYMSAGLPVIASNFELWREVVEGGNCGMVVEPTSPEHIAEAIDTLLGNYELRGKMGANGREAVREKYNWEHESLKLLNLYEEVLN